MDGIQYNRPFPKLRHTKLIVIATLCRHFDWGHVCIYYCGRLYENQGMNSSNLSADDIPGASLGDREPEKFKIAELRFWLQCRGARGLSKLKTKADYVQL